MADDDDELPKYWNYWTMPDYAWASGEERLREEYFHRGGNSVPDMVEWARRSWTDAQAAALTFGKDPDEIDRDNIDPNIPFSRYFRAVLNRINRAQEAGWLPDPIPPKTYVGWTRQTGIDVPPSLLAIAVDHAWITKLFEDTVRLPRRLTAMRMERDKQLRENERLQAEIQELKQSLQAEIRELKQKLAARARPKLKQDDAKAAIDAIWPDGLPSRAELRNNLLEQRVARRLTAMGKEVPDRLTILRAAGRRK